MMDYILLLLIARHPELTDGAKVTLMEMIPHFSDGRLPSTSELSTLRETDTDTIRNHMKELVQADVLLKTPTIKVKRMFTYNPDALAKAQGVDRLADVDFEALKRQGVHKPEAKLKPRGKPADKMNPTDLLKFFYAVHQEVRGFRYKAEKKDHIRIKHMVRTFGAFVVHKGISAFMMDGETLGVQDYTIRELFEKHQGIMEVLAKEAL